MTMFASNPDLQKSPSVVMSRHHHRRRHQHLQCVEVSPKSHGLQQQRQQVYRQTLTSKLLATIFVFSTLFLSANAQRPYHEVREYRSSSLSNNTVGDIAVRLVSVAVILLILFVAGRFARSFSKIRENYSLSDT